MLKRMVMYLLITAMVVSFSACGGNTSKNEGQTSTSQVSTGVETEGTKSTEDIKYTDTIEYTAYFCNYANVQIASNDVVTPYVEKKFGLKLKEFMPQVQNLRETLNAWIATNNIPDVLVLNKTDGDYCISTGKFADLTDYVKEMPNFNKTLPQMFLPRFMTDGHLYQIPIPITNLNDPKYADDPYNEGIVNWGINIREDILAKTGYTFKTLAQIKKDTIDQGKKPTVQDFNIEPAISTPEDFYNLLKKIKDLNITVNGKALIPFSIIGWIQLHLGSMFDFGNWEIGDDGKADGWLGSVGAKDYYKYMNKLYNEGLLDKDFIIQKDDQLQTKIATGQVAATIYFPDKAKAQAEVLKISPDAQFRQIMWPKQDSNKGFYDLYEGGYWRMLIKKDFKDLKRMTEFLDWTLSDEGFDILTYGPESAGLWELKDGKKIFKDKTIEEDVQSGKLGGKGSDYYGLYSVNAAAPQRFYSKAGAAGISWMALNPKDPRRNYPPKLDIANVNASISNNSIDYTGRTSYGDGSAVVNDVQNYFWSKWYNLEAAKLFTVKTSEQFDAAWDKAIQQFKTETKYDEASANMTKWFQDNSAK